MRMGVLTHRVPAVRGEAFRFHKEKTKLRNRRANRKIFTFALLVSGAVYARTFIYTCLTAWGKVTITHANEVTKKDTKLETKKKIITIKKKKNSPRQCLSSSLSSPSLEDVYVTDNFQAGLNPRRADNGVHCAWREH